MIMALTIFAIAMACFGLGFHAADIRAEVQARLDAREVAKAARPAIPVLNAPAAAMPAWAVRMIEMGRSFDEAMPDPVALTRRVRPAIAAATLH